MILVSNPTKVDTSYSLKLLERRKRLSNFDFHWLLLEQIKTMHFSQECSKFCHIFFFFDKS